MSLLSTIVASFNPRGPVAAAPPPVTPPVPPSPTHSVIGSDAGDIGRGQDLAPDVVYEPQPRPAVVMPQPLAGAVVNAKAEAVREIGLYDFDAVRLHPAVPFMAETVVSQPAPAAQVAIDPSQPAAAMQAASIYTRAFYLLMAESGPSTQQRILRSL